MNNKKIIAMVVMTISVVIPMSGVEAATKYTIYKADVTVSYSPTNKEVTKPIITKIKHEEDTNKIELINKIVKKAIYNNSGDIILLYANRNDEYTEGAFIKVLADVCVASTNDALNRYYNQNAFLRKSFYIRENNIYYKCIYKS